LFPFNLTSSDLFEAGIQILIALATVVAGFAVKEIRAARMERNREWSEHQAIINALTAIGKAGGIDAILDDCRQRQVEVSQIKKNFAVLISILMTNGIVRFEDLNFSSLSQTNEPDKLNLSSSKS
jgi:hypothetical protein